MIKNVLICAAVGLIAGYGVHTLRKRFPYYPPPGATRWGLEQLARIYWRVDDFVLTLLLVGTGVLGLIWYLPLMGWRYLAYPDPGAPGVIMTPSWYIWAVAAVLAGMATLGVFWHPILRRVLGRRYAEFRLYQNWKQGRALPVVVKVVQMGCVPVLFILLFVLSNTYTVFRTERIVIAHPFHESVSHPYSEIVEIRAVRRPYEGLWKRVQAGYEVEFTDDTIWHADKALGGNDACAIFPVFAFAAERSRRVITGPDLYAEAGCEAS